MHVKVRISGTYKFIVASHIMGRINPWSQLSANIDAPVLVLEDINKDALTVLMLEASPWDTSMTLAEWCRKNRTTVDY
jgi:hypothetical protein